MSKHLISCQQFNKKDLNVIFRQAAKMEKILQSGKNTKILQNKILATLFFEPSTRTRNSFETAMLRLGGQVLSNPDMINQSSITKQETLYDTGKIISSFADIIVVRHPQSGAVAELAIGSGVPVINAGEAANEHPTQAILDLYTIQKYFKKIDGLTIVMIGDLKYSRVIHSQCYLLRHYKVDLILVSPAELRLPEAMKTLLRQHGISYRESDDLNAVIKAADVLSSTRIQAERFPDQRVFARVKNFYRLDQAMLQKARKKMIVIAPLPRVDELAKEIDTDPRAKYFEQVKNGVAIRMALLTMLLKK